MAINWRGLPSSKLKEFGSIDLRAPANAWWVIEHHETIVRTYGSGPMYILEG